ncbi:MAG: ABC transporter permease [Chloroflexota bacterium]|nr:MAG: ABC transporter permease [Chloroflexota bacterium]UCF26908.1 MAG: ABC transporter permease [Chloroflexota bacterium]
MGAYIVRRLLQAIPMLLLISIILFALVNIAPGGPLAAQSRSRRISPEKQEAMKRQFGLDKPLPVQYVVWLVGNDWMRVDEDGDGVVDSYGTRKGIIRGDFGFSYRNRNPVLEEIGDRVFNTVYLMSVTLVVVAIVAIPIGVLSAIKQYSKFDITATTLSFMGQAIPEFWLGLILILIFYSWLENPFTGEPLLPSGGMSTLGEEFSIWDRIWHLILPVTMGMVGWVAWYSRFLRSSMLDVKNQDYIRTARAKGQQERIIYMRHALKNALIPLVTMFALDFPYIFAGSLYVELLFSWPGMGRLYYDAATARDYPVLMAVLIIGAGIIIIANLMADIAYAYLDPRVRYD